MYPMAAARTTYRPGTRPGNANSPMVLVIVENWASPGDERPSRVRMLSVTRAPSIGRPVSVTLSTPLMMLSLGR